MAICRHDGSANLKGGDFPPFQILGGVTVNLVRFLREPIPHAALGPGLATGAMPRLITRATLPR